MAIYALITVAACSAIWNTCTLNSAKLLAGILMFANGFVIFLFVRRLKKERDAGDDSAKKE